MRTILPGKYLLSFRFPHSCAHNISTRLYTCASVYYTYTLLSPKKRDPAGPRDRATLTHKNEKEKLLLQQSLFNRWTQNRTYTHTRDSWRFFSVFFFETYLSTTINWIDFMYPRTLVTFQIAYCYTRGRSSRTTTTTTKVITIIVFVLRWVVVARVYIITYLLNITS